MLNKVYVYISYRTHQTTGVQPTLSAVKLFALFCDAASKSNVNEFAEFDGCFAHPLP